MIELTAAAIGLMRQVASHSRRRRFKPVSIHVAAVIELTRLGDVLSAIPAIRALRDFFPYAVIHFVVDAAHAALVDAMQLGVHVLAVRNPKSYGSLLSVRRYLRKTRPDIAISLSPSKRNAFLALTSRARKKVGYLSYVNTLTPHLRETPVDGFGFVPAARVSYGRENIYDRSVKVLTALGGQYLIEENPSPVQLKNGDAIGQDLRSRNVVPVGDYVVIHPFAGWVYRTWDLRRFGELGRSVISEFDTDVVFLSEEKDQAALQELQDQFGDEPRVRFVSFLDLVEVAVLIQRSKAFVGNDSGPLHLAAALGTPVVGLFGPAPPELTGPNIARGKFFYKRVECSPCAQRKCERPNESCMTLIGEEEVFEH